MNIVPNSNDQLGGYLDSPDALLTATLVSAQMSGTLFPAEYRGSQWLQRGIYGLPTKPGADQRGETLLASQPNPAAGRVEKIKQGAVLPA